MAVLPGGSRLRTYPAGPLAVLREAAIVLLGILVYFGVRGLTESDVHLARENAALLVQIERMTGLFQERALQETLAGSHQVVTLMNWVYIWCHWPVIIATLAWLALRHPRAFLQTRNAMLISGAIGLVIFMVFPVAPPRLAGLGVVDTVTEFSRSYRVLQPPAFVNQYAAMPSLHAGWDLLIGLAIAANARARAVRALGVLLPVAMAFAVILTGNHYILDFMAGIVLVLGARAAATTLLPAPPPPSLPPEPRRLAMPAPCQATSAEWRR